LVTLHGLIRTVPLALLFIVESVVIKWSQLSAVGQSAGFSTLFQVSAGDLSFVLFASAFFCAAISALPKAASIVASVLHFLFMLYALMFTAASHGYFLATGENLSWSGIEIWLANFKEVSSVMASEQTAGRAVFAYGQVVPVALLALAPLLPPIRRFIAARRRLPPVPSAAGIGAVLAVSLGLAFVPDADGPAQALSRCVAGDILADLVRDRVLPEEEITVSEKERLDASLVIEPRAGAPRPNVVVMVFESLNWKSSDVHTPGLGVTPFLAELAKKSLVVEHQYSVVPHTTKALVSINCGIYPYLDTEAKEATPGILPRRCLAHILRNQGYATAFFQPAANFEKRDLLVANMGYETYRGLNDMPQEGYEQTNYFGREERMVLRPSMDWVDSQRGRPFLLTYLTLSTHHNYITPQSFPYVEYPVEDLDHRNFYNAAHYIDTFFSEVFAEFEKRKLLDNTVFIIVGDHGEAFGEHGRRQHDLVLWEEGLRSFSMIYAPGMFPEPGRITGYRSHLDIVPTVADLLGLEVKEGEFLGSSLLGPAPEDRSLYFSCWFRRRCLGVRQGNVKTLFHYGLKQMEVFDADADPFDERNLALSPTYDQAFLDQRKEEMERFAAVVNQQYRQWEKDLSARAVSNEKPEVATPLPARFADSIELVGVDITPAEVEAGGNLNVRYVFKCLDDLSASQKLFVHFVHRSGTVNADHVPGWGAYPLEKWEPGKYLTDEQTIHVPATWTSGDARLMIGFWDTKTGRRLEISGTDEISGTEAKVDDRRLVVGAVHVKGHRPVRAVTTEERRAKAGRFVTRRPVPMEVEGGAVFGDKVELAGLTLSRMDVHLAGTVEMAYLFRAMDDVPSDWKLTVKLIRDDGETIDGDHVPIGGLYPPGDWQTGEYVLDQHKIHIDMHLCKPGSYGVWLGFRSRGAPVPARGPALTIDSSQRVRIGTVEIRAGEKPGL